MEQLNSLLLVLATVFGTLGFGWVFRRAFQAGENNIKNQQTEETLKNVRESKKIDNAITNMDDIELNERLQKYVRDHD